MQRWRWWWYTLEPVERLSVIGWCLFGLLLVCDVATAGLK